jgi:alanine-glyoxylate transaminase/serine-glyoxylate transaminase/serine-pyruvate transaminase
VFIKEMGSALKNLRAVHMSQSGQPFILSGSGTLGWDLIASNLCERGHRAVVVNTGYFSDSFVDCLSTYGVDVTQVKCPTIGDSVTDAALHAALTADKAVHLVVLTQVDTSTAVLNDVKALAATVRQSHPNAFIAVDGVCSFGGERFLFDDWGIDAAMSCSQKALGAPPGLCTLVLSQRAMEFIKGRKTPIPSYFGSLLRWLPIMAAYEAGQAAYFATPNVNLIRALDVSLQSILAYGLEQRWADHVHTSDAVKAAMEAIGIRQVPAATHRANTLSALYYPDGIDTAAFLGAVMKEGVICAGGLHKDIRTKYFRVGHLGVSVSPERDDVARVVRAVETALTASGYKFEAGKASKVYEATLTKTKGVKTNGKL